MCGQPDIVPGGKMKIISAWFRFAAKNGVFVELFAAAAFLAILNGCTKPAKVYRVGILYGAETMSAIGEGFKESMGELGYIEKENIIYDEQHLDGEASRDREIADKFASDRVDLVFVFPGQPALTVKERLKNSAIPVVFANALIENTDLIESVQNPGGNISGVRNPGNTMTVKSLEYLLGFEPAPERVMVIYVPSYPTNPDILKALRSYASAAEITLIELPVAGIDDIESALRGLSQNNAPDAVLLMPDTIPRTRAATKIILDYAQALRIPVIGGPEPLLREGTLLTITADYRNQGELAASVADRIFKGVAAGSIPVVTPEEQLFVNYARASELGLKPSRGVLRQAKDILR